MALIPSVDGRPGLDRVLQDWLSAHIDPNSKQAEFYEVEAKLGMLIDRGTRERVVLPVTTETVLASGQWFSFESDLPMSLHQHFNGLLNRQVQAHALTYSHLRTVDRIFEGSSSGMKYRVSTGEGMPKPIAIEKRRVSDIAIYFPNAPFDIRISINLELPIPMPIGVPLKERQKDRISYKSSDGLQVDLTQVKQSGELKPRHELEIECMNPIGLISTPALYKSFIDGIRSIVFATIK